MSRKSSPLAPANTQTHNRTRRGNGNGTITKRAGRKTKPWVGRVRLDDGRRPTIYGETKDEVRLEIQRIRAAEADGKQLVITAERLEELFELWLKESVSKKRPKTAASYESEGRRNLLPLLGRKRLRELTAAHIQALVNRLEGQTCHLGQCDTTTQFCGRACAGGGGWGSSATETWQARSSSTIDASEAMARRKSHANAPSQCSVPRVRRRCFRR
jgi:Phage integrase, N-terminal SAM-like domain